MQLLVVGESEAIVQAIEQLLRNLEQTELEEEIRAVARTELDQLSSELSPSLGQYLDNLEQTWSPAAFPESQGRGSTKVIRAPAAQWRGCPQSRSPSPLQVVPRKRLQRPDRRRGGPKARSRMPRGRPRRRSRRSLPWGAAHDRQKMHGAGSDRFPQRTKLREYPQSPTRSKDDVPDECSFN